MQHLATGTKTGHWLVLGGSGMRMYAFLGALRAAVEEGYTFTGVTCTSGGAIVGGALGKHWDPADPTGSIQNLHEHASQIDIPRLLAKSLRVRFWEWLIRPFLGGGPRGPFDSRRILKELRKHAPPTIGDCSLPVQITAYQSNLKSPKPIVFYKPDTDLPLAMLASVTLPVFDPTPYGKALLEDGGWVRNLPIPETEPRVLAFYFDDVEDTDDTPDIVEDESRLRPLGSSVDRLLRIVDGMTQTSMRDSINEAEEEGVQITKVLLRTTLQSFDFFADRTLIDKAIDEGYRAAKDQLRRSK